MKTLFAVIAIMLLISALNYMTKNTYHESFVQQYPIPRQTHVAIILLIGAWVLLSGIGGYVFQNPDHATRNTIFNMLVQMDWPIYNLTPTATLPNPVALVYYIGFWLPAAIVGKIFGLGAGYFAQYLWAMVGLYLLYRLIANYLKTNAIWPLLLLIFFSGLDILGTILVGQGNTITPTSHLEWWNWPFQYSSITTDLFWVFNQAIPIWLIAMLIYTQKDNRNIFLLLSLSMLTSTLPFLGLIPIALMLVFTRKVEEKMSETEENKWSVWFKSKLWPFLKQTITYQNTVAAGTVALVSWLYLKDNNAAQLFSTTNHEFTTLWNFIKSLALFLSIEVLPYGVLLFRYQRKNKLYWTILVLLTIIPVFKIGLHGDFAMRASIPALFFLYLLTAETLQKAWEKKDRITLILLMGVIAIGAATPLMEINRTLYETYSRWRNGKEITAGTIDLTTTPADNFWGDLEGNYFFQYLAK